MPSSFSEILAKFDPYFGRKNPLEIADPIRGFNPHNRTTRTGSDVETLVRLPDPSSAEKVMKKKEGKVMKSSTSSSRKVSESATPIRKFLEMKSNLSRSPNVKRKFEEKQDQIDHKKQRL